MSDRGRGEIASLATDGRAVTAVVGIIIMVALALILVSIAAGAYFVLANGQMDQISTQVQTLEGQLSAALEAFTRALAGQLRA
jgi:FlaG/FlaF family flagellin (archaellin)